MAFILDTDIGSDVDDALALALIAGSPDLVLHGITTVYGDSTLRARLARRYLRLAGAAEHVRIAAGLEQARSGREVWWTGHEGALFTDLESEPVEADAVQFLVDAIASRPGELDVLAIGPLTNIAAALDADPTFESGVRRLVLMGGDFRPERRRIAEHNILCDVDAAQRVFDSRLAITVGGLDLTEQVGLRRDDVDRIAAAGPLGAVLADEIATWWRFLDADANTPHDPIVALHLAAPELFSATRARVTIDADGMSLATIDPEGPVSILDVADGDGDRIKEEILRRIEESARVPLRAASDAGR